MKMRSPFYSISLVLAQFGCLGVIVLSGPLVPTSLLPLCLLTAGLALGLWALFTMSLRRLSVFPDPLPQTELVRSGPYRLTRHPMYTSLLLATLGWVLALPVWWRWGLWVGLLIVLITKLTYEEQLLQSRFADYQLYKQRTWRLFPWIW